jgi:hypothetical protein
VRKTVVFIDDNQDMSKNFTVLNTVNSGLCNEGDFIIHAQGCTDCNRGAAATCSRETIAAENVAEVEQAIRDDLEESGFEADEVTTFVIIAKPCAA